MYMSGMSVTQTQEEQIETEKLTMKIINFNLVDSPLTIKEIKWVIREASKILKESSTVLNLSLPVKIVGDVYGHYNQLVKVFQVIGSPSQRNYLFLGNYVGKGTQSIESLITLLFFKIRYPQNFFLLRGRCEVAETNFMFGFYEECATKHSQQLWTEINQIFGHLPLAAVVDKQIFCSSSGLIPEIKTIEQMNNIYKSSEIVQIPEILSFLTSKPKISHQKKGNSNQKDEFTYEMAIDWMRQNNFTLMIRSNQILEQGLEFCFKGSVLSICSMPNVLNVGNIGIVASINQNCQVSFTAIKSTK